MIGIDFRPCDAVFFELMRVPRVRFSAGRRLGRTRARLALSRRHPNPGLRGAAVLRTCGQGDVPESPVLDLELPAPQIPAPPRAATPGQAHGSGVIRGKRASPADAERNRHAQGNHCPDAGVVARRPLRPRINRCGGEIVRHMNPSCFAHMPQINLGNTGFPKVLLGISFPPGLICLSYNNAGRNE